MPEPTDTVRLASGDAAAEIALVGAEPLRWNVGGRDLLWSGDPAHWSYRAPILFPVVGASAGGVVTVDGGAYPMAQHGFARTSRFQLLEQDGASCRLRLAETDESWAHYPFRFVLDVTVVLTGTALSLAFEVTNTDMSPLPYGLGVHPAFPWPLSGQERAGHHVVFAEAEGGELPEIAPGGLLARTTRRVPLDGRVLPLDPALFTEALVFLDARSRAFAFQGPSGASITMALDGFPHLAVWSRPDAPFLSLEAWTAHADWADAAGELRERASMTVLAPGAIGRHVVRLGWIAPAG